MSRFRAHGRDDRLQLSVGGKGGGHKFDSLHYIRLVQERTDGGSYKIELEIVENVDAGTSRQGEGW